jgi:uncharacterized Fe-S cluster-containing radical SAM superfamily enzyme
LGYNLQWLDVNPKAGADMLIRNKILPGIAEEFVSKIGEWAAKINTN